MTADKPPAVDSLDAPTGDLQSWTRDGQILGADRIVVGAWLDAVTQAADKLQAQIAIAEGLVINEGVVGSFTSAKTTAQNLNQTADAIRQRLSESAEFTSALKGFSKQAYDKIFAQDEH